MLDINQILKILPHRYPFLLVDKVSEVSEEKIVAHKYVTVNEPHFNGHFPGMPVMPGVLMIEALAQAGAILAHQSGGFDPATQNLFFMTIDKAKFRRPVRPGDRLDLEVVPLRKGGRVWKLKGEGRVDGELVVEAELMATMSPRG
ncbi:MAG: 3-hydroxyacyl-ACP dehydratase FabZ [Deltaproteobacteria bacterium]|nr:3-hydroxyacyl-ACP dehydratase FabZ [Deltaproteobacteria bacterium]